MATDPDCVNTFGKINAQALTNRLNNASSGIGLVIANIEGKIDSIERATDCEYLQTLIPTLSDDIQRAIDGVQKQIQGIAGKFLKLLKVPGSLQKVISFVKDLIVSTIAPQLQAYIKLTQDLIKLTQVLSRVTDAIEQVIPKIQQCAIDEINEQIYGLQSAIDISINAGIIALTNEINQQLCDLGPTLQDLGLDLNDAAVGTIQLVQSSRSLAEQTDLAISNTLNTIGNIGNSLQQIAPITFNIDTSNKEAFERSIAAGAFTEFTNSVEQFANLLAPTNTSPPTITGTVGLGQTLTSDTGQWQGDGNTFEYQWYRNDLPINNATNPTYQLIPTDGNGSKIYCQVLATNVKGQDLANTATITTTFVTGGLFSYGQRIQ